MNDRVEGPNTRFSITDQEALQFHSRGRPGKLEIMPTKPMATQRDLSLAYSPGVAVPVKAIAADPSAAYDYTTRGNMVAVISNGTAILGLGNLGALASKPVMEGKAVLVQALRRRRLDRLGSRDRGSGRIHQRGEIPRARRLAGSISRTSRRRSASTSRSACAR